MDDRLAKALAAGARAFADALEAIDYVAIGDDSPGVPTPGSAESMRLLLRRVAEVNDSSSRGASQEELSRFAREAGMDPRGTAGYYSAPGGKALLETRHDGRWVTDAGRERLSRLEAA